MSSTRPRRVWTVTTGAADAQALVLIHGSLDRSSGMLKLARRLEPQFRVTRYDRRGYGRSLGVGGPFGVAHQVSDLIGVLDACDGGRPSVLFGHSFGGHVALATAHRHPDRVSAVAVYEAPLPWLDWWPTDTAGRQAAAWAHDPSDAAERFMRRLVGDATWERLPSSTRSSRRLEGPALIGELATISRAAPWTAAGVGVPVLAMCGERGRSHHRRAAAVLAEWFGSDPVVIAGARHFGPNTHPDDVATALTEWLGRLSTSAPPRP